jgi:hypothetical protein
MPFTQTDIDALDAAYKQGARQIRSADGKTLEFHSVDDYIKLRNLMQNDASSTSAPAVRMVRTYTDSGW